MMTPWVAPIGHLPKLFVVNWSYPYSDVEVVYVLMGGLRRALGPRFDV